MVPTHDWFEKSEAQKEMERRERLRAAEEAEREAKRQEEEEEKVAHAHGMSLAESRQLSMRVCEVLEEYAEAYLRPNLRHADGYSYEELQRQSKALCRKRSRTRLPAVSSNIAGTVYRFDCYDGRCRSLTYQWAIRVRVEGGQDRTHVQVSHDEGMLVMSRRPREQLDLEVHLGLEALAHALHRSTRLRVKVSVYWPGPWTFYRQTDPGL